MIVRKVVSCSLSTCFLYPLSMMDDSDLVYFDVDAAAITAASLTLGKDEGGLVESLSNHASYKGRRLRTNVHSPGTLRRRGGLFFGKILPENGFLAKLSSKKFQIKSLLKLFNKRVVYFQ